MNIATLGNVWPSYISFLLFSYRKLNYSKLKLVCPFSLQSDINLTFFLSVNHAFCFHR